MSAAFALDYTGPTPKCDYPGCKLDSFHDGDHDTRELVLVGENDARLGALVTSYGLGTHSYNGSAEKREMDRQRAEVTARYEAGPRTQVLAPLLCPCPQRPYPHELSIHQLTRQESYNPKLKYVWPWSLCLSVREEPSTERKQNGSL